MRLNFNLYVFLGFLVPQQRYSIFTNFPSLCPVQNLRFVSTVNPLCEHVCRQRIELFAQWVIKISLLFCQRIGAAKAAGVFSLGIQTSRVGVLFFCLSGSRLHLFCLIASFNDLAEYDNVVSACIMLSDTEVKTGIGTSKSTIVSSDFCTSTRRPRVASSGVPVLTVASIFGCAHDY